MCNVRFFFSILKMGEPVGVGEVDDAPLITTENRKEKLGRLLGLQNLLRSMSMEESMFLLLLLLLLTWIYSFR